MNKTTAILLFLCGTIAVSCTQIKQSFEDTFKTDQPPSSLTEQGEESDPRTALADHESESDEYLAKPNFLAELDALQSAEHQLLQNELFKGHTPMVHSSVHFYGDGRVHINLQNPDIPTHLDSYSYRDGKWGSPEPVSYRDYDEIQKELYPFDSVSFSAVHRFYQELQERMTDIPEVEPVTHIYYIPESKYSPANWRASIVSPRERYSAKADSNGKIMEFKRS